MTKLQSFLKKQKISSHNFRLDFFYILSSLFFIFSQLIYLNLRFSQLTEKVPLFYTQFWGESQLADRGSLFLIPIISISVSLLGFAFLYFFKTKFYKYGSHIIFVAVQFCHFFLTFSLFRIITKSLLVTDPLVSYEFVRLFVVFIFSLTVSLIFSPYYVSIMEKWKIVTDSSKHSHPGMILKSPSARGGGLFFALLFIPISILLVSITPQILGVLAISFILALIGFLDDIQNTSQDSRIKFLENPLIRLGLLFLVVGSLYFFNIKIDFFTNPFNGFFDLSDFTIVVGHTSVQPLSLFFTTVWVVWLLNLLSWSNGVDGQYSGIVGLGLIVLTLLSLRFSPLTKEYMDYAILSVVASGVSLGLTRVTWHPSKIMWGFGAMSVGLVLSALSILVRAKIIASILILLIPFIDALVTFFRRLLSGKPPWKGDKKHLHHLLMAKGFTEHQVAAFYWLVTALFGGLSLLTIDSPLAQGILIVLGVIFFAFIVVSLRLSIKKQLPPNPE